MPAAVEPPAGVAVSHAADEPHGRGVERRDEPGEPGSRGELLGQEAGRAGLLPDRRAQAVAGIPDEALPGAGPHRAVFGHVLSHSGMVTSVTMFPARITGHHYFSKLIA